jgi:uncharacterized protein YjbJ (UPF0337 family)
MDSGTTAALLLGDDVKNLIVALLTMATLIGSLVVSAPAMAAFSPTSVHSLAVFPMTKNIDAQAKKAEGRLESAYGDLTGDTGHKIKGAAKQVQGSAMNVAADVQAGAESAARETGNKARKIADKAS